MINTLIIMDYGLIIFIYQPAQEVFVTYKMYFSKKTIASRFYAVIFVKIIV